MKSLPKPKRLGVFGIIWGMIRGGKFFFLKCDKKGCIYQAWYPYPHQEFVDEPCPLCGSNLCTQEDMDAFILSGGSDASTG